MKISANKYSFTFILFLLFVCFHNLPSHAQSEWEKTYGGAENDAGHFIQKTHDGNFIIVGFTESFGAGGKDVWLLKVNEQGDTLWTRTYGGPADDVGNKVRLTSDNGFIIAGYTKSFGAGMADVYLVKTDEYGDTLWTRTYGDSLDDVGNSVVEDDSSGFLVVGYHINSPEGLHPDKRDIYIIKTDAYGDTTWTRIIDRGFGDYANDVVKTAEGDFVVTGSTASNVQYELGGHHDDFLDLMLLQISNSNILKWLRIYKCVGGNEGRSITPTKDNGFFINGFINYGVQSSAYIFKTNSVGDTTWVKRYWSAAFPIGHYGEESENGEYITVGSTTYFENYGNTENRHIFAVITNNQGDTVNSVMFNNSLADDGFGFQQTSDGEIIIVGSTDPENNGKSDLYLIKTSNFIKTDIKEQENNTPESFKLYQNYPNPFNPETVIRYEIPKQGNVQMTIYNSIGQKVRTLLNKSRPAGEYEISWDGRNDSGNLVSTGIYFCRLSSEGYSTIRKMVFLK